MEGEEPEPEPVEGEVAGAELTGLEGVVMGEATGVVAGEEAGVAEPPLLEPAPLQTLGPGMG